MADDPKLRAFITAVTFADGSVHLNMMAVPDEVCAMTTTGVEAGRRFQGPTAGFAYAELPAEFLRGVLRSIETGKPSGEVVSLVSDNPKPASTPAPTPVLDAARRLLDQSPHGVTVVGPVAEAARRQHPESFCWGEGSPVPQSAWGLTNTIGRCEIHPHAPMLNGRCPICQPTGGAA